MYSGICSRKKGELIVFLNISFISLCLLNWHFAASLSTVCIAFSQLSSIIATITTATVTCVCVCVRVRCVCVCVCVCVLGHACHRACALYALNLCCQHMYI